MPRRARPLTLGGLPKRAFDLFVAALLLILLSPVLLIVALAVKLTSRGPALFWSERVGKGEKPFRMPKFRTMCVDAPLQPREQFAKAQSYLTPIGGFLRRASLDELPQLYCVLRGDMSIVGPRPLLPRDPCIQERRSSGALDGVRPGITGLAQIRGRNLLSTRKKARYDGFYSRFWSLRLDVYIVMCTSVLVLLRKNVL